MFITLGLIAAIILAAIILAPGKPRAEMTTAELNRGCRLSCGSLALVLIALGITVAILLPLVGATP